MIDTTRPSRRGAFARRRPSLVLIGALASVLLLCSGVGPVAEGQGASVRMHGVNGEVLAPFQPAEKASVVFFVATDCPVSNSYAPEIQRVCREYGPKGVGCSLIYEDVDTHASTAPLDMRVRQHLVEYKYAGIPAAVDRERAAARVAKATITPQAVVIDRAGEVRYRGRIDNFYAALGKTRRQVTSHDLIDALDAVLAGRKVPNPETEALGCFIVDPALLRTHHHE